MFLRILKRDLKRKKAMNAILFVFIILCSLFLGASVSNLEMTTNALEKFAEMSHTADYYLTTTGDVDINGWLRGSKNVTDYEPHEFLSIEKNNITIDGKVFTGANSQPWLGVPGQKYNYVFDENDVLISAVKDGECCISNILAEKNDAKIGDKLKITIEGITKTLTIAHITKDYTFGSDYFIMNRVLISSSDYNDFYKEEDGLISITWSIDTNNLNAFINEKNHQTFVVMYEFHGETINMVYHMEKIASAVMMIISLVLIAISFTLLQFTIRTTIEDDYREIGVMKAIGIKNSGVRNLYTAKYLTISVVGAILGAILSIPFTDMLTEGIRKNIVIGNATTNYSISLLSAIAVVAVTMLFCRITTGKVKRMTAIQAIREGSSDERFKRKGLLHLKGNQHRSIPFFMARNDVISSLSSYVIIFIALTAVMQMIILPYNALETLKNGKNMMPYFVQEPADFYADIPKVASDIIVKDNDYDKLVDYIKGLEDRCKKQGLELSVNLGLQFTSQVYKSDKYDQISIQAWKQTDDRPIAINYLNGTAPSLANEIAISKISMERLGVVLGEKVHMVFGEDDKEYIITGSFESMTNNGETIILSPKIYPDLSYCMPLWGPQFNFSNNEDADKYALKLEETLPELEFFTADEKIHSVVEDVIVTMGQIIDMVIILGLIITSLVVFLISSTLLGRDKGAVSLLKSVGFSNQSLKIWQTARIAITALAAAFFGLALSFVLNPFVISQTFGMMGAAHVSPNINTLYVFGIFPGLFILTAILVAWVVSTGVKNVAVRNVGNFE